MGCVTNIDYDNFPKQSNIVGREVEVCYHYDTRYVHHGVIVRDDIEAPGQTIIKLDNGRYLRAEECHYSLG